MDIIAHRGFWVNPKEKNTPQAFRRAFQNGFGVETDFRDSLGRLVISHDVPRGPDNSISYFLELYAQYPVNAPIAINIKSDGLQGLIADFIHKADLKNCYVFDMAVPDMREYFLRKIPVYSRVSDQESPAFLDSVDGVWFDAFQNELLDAKLVNCYLDMGKKMTFVSSELHGRDHVDLWKFIRDEDFHQRNGVSICTDLPDDARKYFPQ